MLLSDYIAALRGGWKIILAILVVAIGLSFVPTLTAEPSYTSNTDLFVATSANTNDPEELYQRNAIALQRLPSYVLAAQGNLVTSRVADELGHEPGASVGIEGVSGTVVIRVTATSSDAEEARDVAAAYAAVIPGVIDEIEEVGDQTAAQVRLTVVDEADLPSASPRSFLPNLVLAIILGLGLGLVIVLLRETLRRERRAERADSTGRPTPSTEAGVA